MAVRQWKFRTVHNRSRAPLRRSRLICCAIATSALPRTKTAPRDPILPSFSTCRYLGVGPFIPLSSFPFPHYRFPDPVASLSFYSFSFFVFLHLFPSIRRSIYALLLFASRASFSPLLLPFLLFSSPPPRAGRSSQCIKREGLTRLSVKLNLFPCRFL